MSFYRTMLAAVATLVIASPVLADDAMGSAMTATPSANSMSATTSTSSTTTTTTSTTTHKINLNTASTKDLLKVKGINSSRAKAIIAYRKKNGNFTSVSDLAKVKGFTKMSGSRLQAIEGQLTAE